MKKRGTKRASLQYQFIMSINKCFRENIDKKSLKIQKRKGLMTEAEERAYNAKVWSYKYKNNLIKFVKSFISWLKENGYYNEYKYAYELDSEIFSLYLRDLRLNKRNTYSTMKTYESYIRKLEHIMSYTRPSYCFDYTSQLEPVKYRNKSKIRVYSLNKNQYLQLMRNVLYKTYNEPTGNDLGILLACAFGYRSRGVCSAQFRDILTLDQIKEKGEYKEVFYISPYDVYVRMKEKGGDIRYIPVVFRWQYELVQYIQNLQKKHDLNDNYYITSLSNKKYTKDGFRKQVRKRLSEIGVRVSVPSSSHMIRKTWSKLMLEYFKKHPEGLIREHTKYFKNS
jgi:integrase